MIKIVKGKEPVSWTKHHNTPGAEYEASDDLRDALLKDQGYICAYCMRRIPVSDKGTKETSRIEHVTPQDILTREEAMYYSNMVICCPGAISGTAKELAHCDRSKGERPIHFTPFDDNFINTISYKTDGTIESSIKECDEDLNKVLNLNLPLLKSNRKEVRETLVKTLGKGTWTKPALEKTLKATYNKDKDGMLQPYCGVIRWYISKRLRQIER